MILVEIISETSIQLFDGIPIIHQKATMDMYDQILKCCSNKPQFVKFNSFELLRLRFIQNEFKVFNVPELIQEFTNYYYKIKDSNPTQVNCGYLEDFKEIVWNFLHIS